MTCIGAASDNADHGATDGHRLATTGFSRLAALVVK